MRQRLMRFDARAWVVWVLAMAVVAMAVRNPLYTLILLLVSRLVANACAPRAQEGLRLPLWRVGLFVLLFSALFNALFVRAGETALLRLPRDWPLLGGAITLESLVYGAESGLILLTLLSLFIAFNRLVPMSELVRLTPRAFHDLGVVLLIAITYVPETARHWRRIREAQMIRGHRLHGLRDWRPIIIPLLVGGLERALGVAEAMVARGYGATAGRPRQSSLLAGLVLSLGLLFLGWALALWRGWPGWVLLALGMASLGFLIWRRGRNTSYTHYRPPHWRPGDSALLLVSLLPLLALWLVKQRADLLYTPYPRVQLPPFNPWLGLALATLALPAFIAGIAPAERQT